MHLYVNLLYQTKAVTADVYFMGPVQSNWTIEWEHINHVGTENYNVDTDTYVNDEQELKSSGTFRIQDALRGTQFFG